MTEHPLLPHGSDVIFDLYRRYIDDPGAVDASWRAYFDGIDSGAFPPIPNRPTPAEAIDGLRTALVLGRLIEAYRWRGHLGARVDPLGLAQPRHDPELLLDRLGLAVGVSDLSAALYEETGLGAGPLRRVLARLEEIYCGSIGFEFMHVRDAVAREWLREAIESGWGMPDRALRRQAAERLIEADELEQFMQRRFTGKKRFGAEGAESLVPCLWVVLDHGARHGLRHAVIGGTSRGRLNQLVNVVGKPVEEVFAELMGDPPFPPQASGDVAYHLGYAGSQRFGAASVRIDYCSNPSHLEAVDPVAMGRVRALQAHYADRQQAFAEVMGLSVHTDAAFAGQGLVAEVLQLGGLPHYAIGGTVRTIINNQIGFTTEPAEGRSSTYCSDVAKAVGAPVLHVNGDDVDAVVRAAAIAAEFRRRFAQDVVIDLVCYRRRGHNEVDEPSFTQPLMYRAIAAHKSTRVLYLERLAQEGVLERGEAEALGAACRDRLERAYAAAKAKWSGAARATAPRGGSARDAPASTGLPLEQLRALAGRIAQVPADFDVNAKIVRLLRERSAAAESGQGISWAFAEALALASLLAEGTAVRLSGQDTPRGAFSQRHFILHDQRDGRRHVIFDALPPPRGRCEIVASPLAEYATLGFEYGYSLDAPQTLVVWEAQFGDFANVAQVIIDQFISSGADKWLQASHVTLLLPHGLEGQGPEHSSARIERVLQLCARDNLCVANCTTPANYFHLLRRQAQGPRRPLIVFTPKSLLRHRHVVSSLAEMGPGTAFQPVYGPGHDTGSVRRIVLCTGKVYWDLVAARQQGAGPDVAVVRLEQLYPFPDGALANVLQQIGDAELVWCQEEPQNMGAWSFVSPRVAALLRRLGWRHPWPLYVGRPDNPSPAIGGQKRHDADQARLVAAALGGTAQQSAVVPDNGN